MSPTTPTVRPYGSWPSPLSAAELAAGAVRLDEVRTDGDDVWWVEARPAEDGRHALVRWRDGVAADAGPEGFHARTRVHEYGGGVFAVRDGTLVASSWNDQRLYRLDSAGPATPLTPEPAFRHALRHADPDIAPGGAWVACVREDHHGDGQARNTIVAAPLDGAAAAHPETAVALAGGHDFVANPRWSPDGDRLAWMAWDHPAMPWDATVLYVAAVTRDADGRPGLRDARVVAGGPGESVVQPVWTPDGALVWSSDASGWWNLEELAPDGARRALTDLEADIGAPQWTFAVQHAAAMPDGRLACAVTAQAVTRLAVLDRGSGRLDDLDAPLTSVRRVAATADRVVAVGAGPTIPQAVVAATVPPSGRRAATDHPADHPGATDRRSTVEVLRTASPPSLAGLAPPPAEPVTFETTDGDSAHAFLHRPFHPDVEGPDDERPPLLVLVHGGPTGHVAPVLDPSIAFWTTRGFAVADVNYRGSSGYGRSYRRALDGRWGVADVEDAVAAARVLGEGGDVDPDRRAISGGSAGGLTTLLALMRPDTPFAAGTSLYGVTDLAALARDTHKFESRYLDRLVGPWPQAAEVYRERSPLSRVDELAAPILVLQGDEDEVVPPDQAEQIAAAAAIKGLPHAYVLFEGEQHGFRRADTIARALEAELSFYGQVLGFAPADDLEPVTLATGAGDDDRSDASRRPADR